MAQAFANVVAFQASNAAGDQTITDANGIGLTPKAALFVMGGANSLDTLTNHARCSIGATDGTTSCVVAGMAEDNQVATSADAGYRIDTATVIQVTGTASETLTAEASFVSFAANAVTINWSSNTSVRGFVILFYGSDLSANVTSFASSATIGGTASTTAPGFTPDIVFAFGCGQAFVADGSGADFMVSFGAAARSPSTTQGCLAVCAEDRQSPTSVGQIFRTDALATQITSTAGTVSEGTRLEMTSFDVNGFTITTRNAAVALESGYLSVRLGGDSCWVGVPSLLSSSTGQKTLTGIGFRPKAVALAAGRATMTDTVSGIVSGFSIGAAHGVGGAVIGWNDLDGLSGAGSPSEADSIVSASKVVDVVQNGSAIVWDADLISLDGDGFTYNVSDAAANDLPTVVIAIGKHADSTGYLVERSGAKWRRCLARR